MFGLNSGPVAVHDVGVKPTPARRRLGRPIAFVECGAFLLFLALAFSQTLVARLLMVTVAAAFVAASAVLIWRMLRRRPGDPPVALGQTAAMPRRWVVHHRGGRVRICTSTAWPQQAYVRLHVWQLMA